MHLRDKQTELRRQYHALHYMQSHSENDKRLISVEISQPCLRLKIRQQLIIFSGKLVIWLSENCTVDDF